MSKDNIKRYFEERNYVIIKEFIDSNLANLFYQYCINKTLSTDFKYYYDKESYNEDWDGNWTDPQAPGAYSVYGDNLMDTLCFMSTNTVESYTGLNLVPNYSYWRLYEKGSVLKRHIDRESCEISLTLCLGSNMGDKEKNEDGTPYTWPIYVYDNVIDKEVAVNLEAGDMLIYRGCEIEHWRDRFEGLNQAQVFLHYNTIDGPFPNKFDGRPIMGIPKHFQGV